MQFQISQTRRVMGAAALGLLLTGLAFGSECEAASKKSKHPKGFVHNTAGDANAPAPSPNDYSPVKLPKWQQYDDGGLYYYQRNELEKCRAYWMEALRIAELEVPALHQRGALTPPLADACCKLIRHLLFFVNDSKFRPNYDGSYWGGLSNKGPNPSSYQNPQQYQLDNIKQTLREMDKDWSWYERVCNFADRAVGRQRDCMRQIYSQREIFERRIIMTRQTGQQLEMAMGIDLKHSGIDVRPLKWGGVEGAGNPFSKPGSNPTPLKYRGGAQPGSLD